MLQKYYKNVVLYNLILQYCYSSFQKLPRFRTINLNYGINKKDVERQEVFLFFFFVIYYITNQKPGTVFLRKNSLNLKLRKGSIVGCKTDLRGNNLYNFLYKLLFFFKLKINKKYNRDFNFQIKEVLNFPELRSEFIILQGLTRLNISIKIDFLKKDEFYLLLKNFKKI